MNIDKPSAIEEISKKEIEMKYWWSPWNESILPNLLHLKLFRTISKLPPTSWHSIYLLIFAKNLQNFQISHT